MRTRCSGQLQRVEVPDKQVLHREQAERDSQEVEPRARVRAQWVVVEEVDHPRQDLGSHQPPRFESKRPCFYRANCGDAAEGVGTGVAGGAE